MLSGQSNSGHRVPSPDFAQDSGSARLLATVYNNPQEYRVEQGNVFSVTGFAELQADEEKLIQFRPGKNIPFEMEICPDLQVNAYLYAGTSYDAASAGADLTPTNHIYSGSGTSVVSVKADASITVSGSLLFSGARKANPITIEKNKKYILQSGIEHTLRMISLVASNYVDYKLTWEE